MAVIGYAFSAVCKLGLLAAGSAWSPLVAVIVGDRLGKGIRTAPRDALIAMSAAPEQLATSFGVHRALDAAGAMAGPFVAFGLLALVPGRFDLVFTTSFWVAIVGLAVLVLFVHSTVRRDAGSHSGTPLKMGAALGVFAAPGFGAVLTAACVLAFATISDGFVYLMVQESVRLDATLFPLFYAVTPFCYFVLAGPAGVIADRVGPRNMFIAGHVALLVLYGVLLQPTLGRLAPVAAVVLLGAYYAATDGVLAALASATLPANVRGTGLSLVATGTNVGRVVASLTFGVLWVWRGKETAVLMFAVALCAGLGLAWWRLGDLGRPAESHA